MRSPSIENSALLIDEKGARTISSAGHLVGRRQCFVLFGYFDVQKRVFASCLRIIQAL
jgi:hypothetical protein